MRRNAVRGPVILAAAVGPQLISCGDGRYSTRFFIIIRLLHIIFSIFHVVGIYEFLVIPKPFHPLVSNGKAIEMMLLFKGVA